MIADSESAAEINGCPLSDSPGPTRRRISVNPGMAKVLCIELGIDIDVLR